MIHKYFDKSFVISVPVRGEDRLKLFTHECKNIGLEFEVFNAIDGYNTSIEWDKDNCDKMEGWTPGAAGLVLTTINLIKQAKEKGYKNILIMEDDIFFTSNALCDAIEAMDGMPKDWELIHFIAHHRQPSEYVAPRVERLKSAWSCQMYAVNESVYDIYLSHLAKVDRPIDSITSEAIHTRGKSYGLRPAIVRTEPNFSFVRNKFINHGV
jgi:GR25 family glycosyltransferase involved in LPS biosynthesis